MVWKCKQVYVLTAELASIKHDPGLLMSTKHMTGFTYQYLPFVNDYSRVLSARQDSLASIYLLSVITHEYRSA